MDGYNRAFFLNQYQIFIYFQIRFPINYFFFSLINSVNALESLGGKSASNIEETRFQSMNVKKVVKIQRRKAQSRYVRAQNINLFPIERKKKNLKSQ